MKIALLVLALSSLFPVSAGTPAGESGRRKVLVICYSLSGRTKAVAEKLRAKAGADFYEIQTVKTYPSSYPGVYEEPRRELEQNDLPVLKGAPPDMSGYDLILVGAPVWWYTVPTPVMRFLRDADFLGKRVAGFCTYDTTLGQYHSHFARQVKNGEVREGISLSYPHRIPAPELDQRLDAWLKAVSE
jgi:flavodoxin